MSDSKLLQHDPLTETDKILRDEYYGRRTGDGSSRRTSDSARKKDKPTHYKVVCISMYVKDIESLEAKVAELKKRGHTKANKSQLIRYALSQLDIETIALPLDPLDA